MGGIGCICPFLVYGCRAPLGHLSRNVPEYQGDITQFMVGLQRILVQTEVSSVHQRAADGFVCEVLWRVVSACEGV